MPNQEEKKKQVAPAPVHVNTQAEKVVPPVQVVAQQATNNPAQRQSQQQTTKTTATTQGGLGQWSEIFARQQQDVTPYARQLETINAALPKAVEEYRRTGRNPLADIVLAQQKPVRNVDEETRLRQTAKLHALNNMISLIGKGIAATGGIRPTPVDNQPIYDIQNRLQRLDDIYRQEGFQFDQNTLMSALRKDQANMQAAQQAIGALSEQQKAYADMYNNGVKNNQDLLLKGAQMDADAGKFQVETSMKTADLNERKRSSKATTALGWANYNAANKPTLLKVYKTGGYQELTPEVYADLVGVLAQSIDQRESDKKGPDGEWIAGKKPLPLNTLFSDNEIAEFKKTGKLSAFSQASLTRLYNEIRDGGYYDPTNETPDWIPDKPRSGYAASVRPQYVDWIKATIQHKKLTGEWKDSNITVPEAREMFDGLEHAPQSDVEKLLKDSGFNVLNSR